MKDQKRKIKKNVRMKALNRSNNPRNRAELVDYDYIHKLSKEEKEWLAQFTDESVHASVKKTKAGKVKAGYLHNTKELAKACTDANNWRNNDIHSVTRTNNLLYNVDSQLDSKDGWYITNGDYTELALIENIEGKESSEELDLVEYLQLRKNFKEDLLKTKDKEYMDKYILSEEHYFDLVTLFSIGLTDMRVIRKVLFSQENLKKFLKNTDAT